MVKRVNGKVIVDEHLDLHNLVEIFEKKYGKMKKYQKKRFIQHIRSAYLTKTLGSFKYQYLLKRISEHDEKSISDYLLW